MPQLKEIILKTRGTGNSTWILNSAIKNPNCIIVSRNTQSSENLEHKYKILLKQLSWYKKLRRKLFGHKQPKFVSLNFNFEKCSLPVIFDNGALME